MSRPAGAWGRLGHRASARLAESRLSPRARAIIRDLLEPGESLADASTWADEDGHKIRGSSAWHYVNVPISAPHYDPSFCSRRGCVVSKIAEFRAVLADPEAPRARRRQALRFFVHLVQDLHQPMHVADHGDRGGNDLQLRYGRYEHTNLHQLWDSGLFRWQYRQHAEAELVRRVTAMADRPEAAGWPRGRVEDWADESLEIGRRAYRVPGTNRALRPGDEIGADLRRRQPPAGCRAGRAVGRPARRDAQRDPRRLSRGCRPIEAKPIRPHEPFDSPGPAAFFPDSACGFDPAGPASPGRGSVDSASSTPCSTGRSPKIFSKLGKP